MLKSLVSHKEFKNAQNNSSKIITNKFIFFVKDNELLYPRLGITISNKVANSPDRHRIKRLIREVFRLNSFLHKNKDYVIIVRKINTNDTYNTILEEIKKLYDKTQHPTTIFSKT